jgi:hypothetical protein
MVFSSLAATVDIAHILEMPLVKEDGTGDDSKREANQSFAKFNV